MILNINALNVFVEQKHILKNFSLNVKKIEIHVIMGPNGFGKSTILRTLSGDSQYLISSGTIEFTNRNLLNMSPEQRSHEGIFLSFQQPAEVGGVTTYEFLKTAFDEKQKYFGLKELSPLSFFSQIQEYLNELKMNPDFLSRNLNEGFSGGEKKRNEILQMLVLEPSLILLDEFDSGLDIDAIKIICSVIKNYSKGASYIIVTHNPRVLQQLSVDYVHIIHNGKIIRSGKKELIDSIETNGYDFD